MNSIEKIGLLLVMISLAGAIVNQDNIFILWSAVITSGIGIFMFLWSGRNKP